MPIIGSRSLQDWCDTHLERLAVVRGDQYGGAAPLILQRQHSAPVKVAYEQRAPAREANAVGQRGAVERQLLRDVR